MGRRHKKGIKKELTARGHKAEALDIMEVSGSIKDNS